MIKIEMLEKLAKEKWNENLMFRTFLKAYADEEKLDNDFKELHEKYFKIYDCAKCRNCCKKLGISIDFDEIDKINLTNEDKSLLEEKYGKYINKDDECPFLCSNNECKLKNNLPRTCKEYPYTNKPERLQSFFTIIDNTFICPVVFEIVEDLKKKYNFKKGR